MDISDQNDGHKYWMNQIENKVPRSNIENFFRNKLSLGETPLSILYKEQANPFKNKPNKLTDRQIKKRKRIVKRRKK